MADNNVFAGGDGSDQFLNQTFVANPLFLDQLVISSVLPSEPLCPGIGETCRLA